MKLRLKSQELFVSTHWMFYPWNYSLQRCF